MPNTIAATFETRRDAEMAVEHLVQEHGIDRAAVTIAPASEANSAGTATAGADLEDGSRKEDSDGEPALAGRLKVTATVEDGATEQVRGAFATYNGQTVAT